MSATTIAEALATDPVYVDPSYAAAVNPSQQQALVDQIEETGLPIHVVLVPLKKGDAFDGDPRTFAAVLKERLDRQQLILITNDAYGKWLTGTEWPTDAHQTRDAASAVPTPSSPPRRPPTRPGCASGPPPKCSLWARPWSRPTAQPAGAPGSHARPGTGQHC